MGTRRLRDKAIDSERPILLSRIIELELALELGNAGMPEIRIRDESSYNGVVLGSPKAY